MDGINKMKVAELKQALKDRSLPISGTKPELIKRLAEALGQSVESSSEPVLEDKLDEDELLNEDTTKPTKPLEDISPTKTEPVNEVSGVQLDNDNGPGSGEDSDQTEDGDITTDTKSEEAKIAKPDEVAKLSDAERLKQRAQKFGVVSDEVKKAQRAEKFGIVSIEDKKAQRAQRFGLPVSGSTTTTTNKIGGGGEIDMEKLKKRAERFGSVISNSLSKVDEDERKRKRAERFGVTTTTIKSSNGVKSIDSDELAAKKKKRAERFGIST